MKTTQISARISEATKERLEEFLRARGLKQSRVVEDALRQYLLAVQTLPPEARIPATLVFTNQSFEEIVRSIENPRKPTPALVKLMKGEAVPEDGLH
jgi:antitoxin component of RelBE/YafQ-DinJ toxin-antitoxin module